MDENRLNPLFSQLSFSPTNISTECCRKSALYNPAQLPKLVACHVKEFTTSSLRPFLVDSDITLKI